MDTQRFDRLLGAITLCLLSAVIPGRALAQSNADASGAIQLKWLGQLPDATKVTKCDGNPNPDKQKPVNLRISVAERASVYWYPENRSEKRRKPVTDGCLEDVPRDQILIRVDVNPELTDDKACSNNSAEDQLQKIADCKETIVFSKNIRDGNNFLIPIVVADDDGLHIAKSVIEKKDPGGRYLVNDIWTHDLVYDWSSPDVSSDREVYVDRYDVPAGWKAYSRDGEWLHFPRAPKKSYMNGAENGINVASAKVFDTFSLKQMLLSTTAQLAGISGFNQASLMGALSNLQGITRDTSYFSAQLTTTPTPGISNTMTSGLSNTNALTNSAGSTGLTNDALTTLQCPAGTLPSIGSSGAQGCSPVSLFSGGAGASTGAGNLAGGSSTQNVAGTGTQTQQSNGSSNSETASQQASTTTTSGGHTGAIAPVPVSSAIPAPASIGLSSADLLAEQVQLNSQITTLRLLLQGAVSDQYLLENSEAVRARNQTTVGFSITLDPPQRFKHAAAEVKIIVQSPEPYGPVSIMNLLPTEKTYNVAKVTSHQDAFGAGVVMEPVNIGVATGRAKDRLFLAKDTDTVALQFSQRERFQSRARMFSRSAQEQVLDTVETGLKWQVLRPCDDVFDPENPEASKSPHKRSRTKENDANDSKLPRQASAVFGWQFRPVLGADYVEPGPRQVFAQLALPTDRFDDYKPGIWIQTRWREYDPKRRVVGAVYQDSCSLIQDPNPISIFKDFSVDDVAIDDMGNGVLRIGAEGRFFASGLSALVGQNTVTPMTFDGNRIEIYANAADLLRAGTVRLLNEGGNTTDVRMPIKADCDHCGITKAEVQGVPRPDGNSDAVLTVAYASDYRPSSDGFPRPYLLIGNQVYGLRESPFKPTEWSSGCSPDRVSGCNFFDPLDPQDKFCRQRLDKLDDYVCKFGFVGATDLIRNAGSFFVRDLRWGFDAGGTIKLEPAFTSLKALDVPDKSSDTGSHTNGGAESNEPKESKFLLTGWEFEQIRPILSDKACKNTNVKGEGNFEIYTGTNTRLCLNEDHFHSTSRNVASLKIDNPGNADTLRVLWHSSAWPGVVEWDLAIPKKTKAVPTATPNVINVGDSVDITFTGQDKTKNADPPNVEFEGSPLHAKWSNATTIIVQVTTAVTKTAGSKQLTLHTLDPKNPVSLPGFNVTRR